MTELKTVAIPIAEVLASRLTAIDGESHLREWFYPLLMPLAGQQRTGEGIALALILAVSDYTRGLPPIMAALMHMRLPAFLPAFTDDAATLETARAYLRAAGLSD